MKENVERLAAVLAPRYRLVSELGKGGMGAVYRATDEQLKRDVAIKLLPPDLATDPLRRARFVRETQLVAGLSHPNVVAIHDVGEQGGMVWFVMQLVEGESLRKRVERTGRQSVAFATKVLQDVAYALAYAHARGIVHRDIKPDNILIERATGRALVADFGIAKLAADAQATTLTGAGVALGTTAYMSPEQAAAERDVDNRSDLYSLGLVGHYMLTGHDVHEGPSPQAVLARVLTRKVPSIRGARPDVPHWLDAALLGLTAAALDDRYASAETLLEQLSQGGQATLVHPAARKIVRLLGVYGLLSTVVAYAWALTNGPPIDSLFSAMVGFLLLSFLADAVSKAGRRGVGWKEIRDAIIEMRQQLAEERVWELARGKMKARGILYVSITLAVFTLIGILNGKSESRSETALHSTLQSLAIVYALASSLVLGWALQLPKPGADIEEWGPPRWLDWLGKLLFRTRRLPGSDEPRVGTAPSERDLWLPSRGVLDLPAPPEEPAESRTPT